MHLRDLLRNPLSDIGYVKTQKILHGIDVPPSPGARAPFVRSVTTAYTQLMDALAGIPEELRVAFFRPAVGRQELYLDFRRGAAFGRVIYRNTTAGLTASFGRVPAFDDALQYVNIPTNGTATPCDKGVQFLSDLDLINIHAQIENNTQLVVTWDIRRLTLGGAILDESTSQIWQLDEVHLEDRIASVRAGALLAKMGFGSTPPAGDVLSALKIDRTRDVGGAAHAAHFAPEKDDVEALSVPDKARAFVTSVLVDTKSNDPLGPLDLLTLPTELMDLDFNRFYRQPQTILDLNVAGRAFEYAAEALDGADFARLPDAIKLASSGDPDAQEFLRSFVHQEAPAKYKHTFIRRDRDGIQIADASPLVIYAKLKQAQGVNDESLSQEVQRVHDDVRRNWKPRVLADHFQPILNSSASGEVFGLNPFQIAGSLHARALALFTESAIRAAIGTVTWKAIDYVPRLRRFQEDHREKVHKLVLRAADEPPDFAIATLHYAQGLASFPAYSDTTDYRLGLFAGRVEGAAQLYELFRVQLARNFALPPLPPNATIDQIFAFVNEAAVKINGTVDELNRLLREARETVKQLQDTLKAWEFAGRAIGTAGYAATGFLIGGPIGAAVGALFGWLFG